MCGILGTLPATTEPVFEHALARLAHRGPDGAGVWHSANGAVSLGHRRLAIIDTSPGGAQPLHRQGLHITFNGEIYNYLEIRKELEGWGRSFQTQTDTEVLLAAFELWGNDCWNKLNGMWAAAIWDDNKQKLTLCRDRFGKKPLFYAQIGSRLVFASEMKAIAPFLPEIRPADHFAQLSAHFFAYEATENCLLAGVRRFPAAHFGEYQDGRLTLSRYWNTLDNLVETPRRYEEQVEAFRELLTDACRLRLRSDVPVGTALSGGVDSSAVFSIIANKLKPAPGGYRAFVASFPNSPLDETEFARMAAQNAGIDPVFIAVDPAEGIRRLEEQLYIFEELYITSPVPMAETYRAMRQAGVVVTLDGHGADELFSGYDTFLFKAFLDCGLNPCAIQNILSAYRGLAPDHPQFRKPETGWKDYLQQVSHYRDWIHFRPYLFQEIKKAFKTRRIDPKKVKSPEDMGALNGALYRLFHTDNLPTLLRNYDRYAMASGVEIRMPFLDPRVVTFCFSLPYTSKIRRGYTKALLRDAAAPFTPPEVIYRKTKMGFQTPIVDWLKGPWREYFMDLIESADFRQSSYIDAKTVGNQIKGVIHNPNATYREGELAYAALAPYLWERAFLNRLRNNTSVQ